MSGGWKDHGHQDRLGKPGWQRQRDNARTIRRHRGICHWCGRPGADRIDHIVPLAQGGTDEEGNRAPIHGVPCHRDKTKAEAAAGLARKRRPSRRRPPEPHPGLTEGGG